MPCFPAQPWQCSNRACQLSGDCVKQQESEEEREERESRQWLANMTQRERQGWRRAMDADVD